MKIRELRSAIAFEAGFPDDNQFTGWFNLTLTDVFNQATALVKYPQLLKLNQVIDCSLTNYEPITGALKLPFFLINSGVEVLGSMCLVQHLITDQIRFRPNADSTIESFLRYVDHFTNYRGSPTRPLEVSRQGDLLMLNPFTPILSTDQIVLDYYTFGAFEDIQTDFIATDNFLDHSTIKIPSLISHLKASLLKRLAMMNGKPPALAAMYRADAKDAYSASLGETEIAS